MLGSLLCRAQTALSVRWQPEGIPTNKKGRTQKCIDFETHKIVL